MTTKKNRSPNLPELLKQKIYKTGQTRGADDDVIFQNRVSRTSTVLIPYELWEKVSLPPEGESSFENGFIVLLKPNEYFNNPNIEQELASKNLFLGKNALIFYETRIDWDNHNPDKLGWMPANSRVSPLNGFYVARVAATTALKNGTKISKGFNSTGMKGAGIRLYEYAPQKIICKCKWQLEALFWLCFNAVEVVIEFGMTEKDAITRKNLCFDQAKEDNLLDKKKLIEMRLTNLSEQTICPLCLEPLSGFGFFNRMPQAMGRKVHDLTITQVNLFHIQELKYGQYNHHPYNVGWGHHHCNVVAKDSGIDETIKWMKKVIQINIDNGYLNKDSE